MRTNALKAGLYLNKSGSFIIPAYETVAETWQRLARQQRAGWPGSVSIHGNLIKKGSAEPAA